MLNTLWLGFFFLGLPLIGLWVGAIWPPFLYSKKDWLAVLLNAMGFVLYALPAFMLSVILCAEDFVNEPITGTDYLQATALTLGVFAAVEGCVLLLRRFA